MDTDNVPSINISPEACGHPNHPHVVASASSLRCRGCGVDLAAALLDRMRASLVRTEGVDG